MDTTAWVEFRSNCWYRTRKRGLGCPDNQCNYNGMQRNVQKSSLRIRIFILEPVAIGVGVASFRLSCKFLSCKFLNIKKLKRSEKTSKEPSKEDKLYLIGENEK